MFAQNDLRSLSALLRHLDHILDGYRLAHASSGILATPLIFTHSMRYNDQQHLTGATTCYHQISGKSSALPNLRNSPPWAASLCPSSSNSKNTPLPRKFILKKACNHIPLWREPISAFVQEFIAMLIFMSLLPGLVFFVILINKYAFFC